MKNNINSIRKDWRLIESLISPNSKIDCEIQSDQKRNIKLLCRIDTIKELDYYKQGGILQYVLNSIIKNAS